jgi:phage gpG-like protein
VKVFSLGEFAAHLLTMEADLKLAEEAIVVKGCKIMQRAAKGMLGIPQPIWAPLKPETIAHKGKGNTPLLETGAMKESIAITAPVKEGNVTAGYVGTNNPKAVFQEFGTSHIPSRPFLGAVAIGRAGQVQEMAAKIVYNTMVNGGRNYHELTHLLHLAKEVAHELADLAPGEDD